MTRTWTALFALLAVAGLAVAFIAPWARSGGGAASGKGATTAVDACEPQGSASACAPGAAKAACPPNPSCDPAAGTAAGASCAAASSCAPGAGKDIATRIPADPARALRGVSAVGPGRGRTDLSPRLDAIRQKYRVPGLAAALIRDGRVVGAGVSGVRRAGGAEPIRLEDRFHLGSCGKSFTAAVAARLVAEGTISWETTLADRFPELVPVMEPRYRGVTLGQLLTHRSGLPSLDRGQSPHWLALSNRGRSVDDQRGELVRFAVRQEPMAMPGASFGYTDLGYAVAGRMLERASERTWEELIERHVAGPIGLKSLGFGAPGAPGSVEQPWGHVFEAGRLRAIPPGPGADQAAPVIGPAGTIHVSIEDWARFAKFHLDAARRAGASKGSELASLYADPYGQGYGMGWAITEEEWAGGRLLSHTGSCGAWAAAIWILPERNTALVVASNYGGPEGFAALGSVASELIGSP